MIDPLRVVLGLAAVALAIVFYLNERAAAARQGRPIRRSIVALALTSGLLSLAGAVLTLLP